MQFSVHVIVYCTLGGSPIQTFRSVQLRLQHSYTKYWMPAEYLKDKAWFRINKNLNKGYIAIICTYLNGLSIELVRLFIDESEGFAIIAVASRQIKQLVGGSALAYFP